jgi:hypothetical protein
LNRLENWRSDFFQAIETHRAFDFAWGTHDCAILTADCIAAITGVDLAAAYRGRYATEQEAGVILAELGYQETAEILAKNFDEIHPSQAIVGDVAVIPVLRSRPWAVAPVVGAELAVFAPYGPLGLVPLDEAVRAFRVEIRGD